MVPMKDPRNFLGKPNLNKLKMQEVFMHTSEPVSTIEGAEGSAMITNSN